MNKSIKKIALSLLLVLVTLVLCLIGNNIFNGRAVTSAEAASESVTDIKIEADKTQVNPGDSITFTVTITSGLGSDMHWDGFSLTVSALGFDGMPSQDNKYFSLDTTFGQDNRGYESNLFAKDEWGWELYNYLDCSTYFGDRADTATNGFLFSVAAIDVSGLLSSDNAVILKYKLKVSNSVTNATVNFGIAKLFSNGVQYDDDTFKNTIRHTADTSAINCNTLSVQIG